MELMSRHLSDDCGCPEEIWMMRNLEVTIHLEPDGRGDMHIDAGDWEHESTFDSCAGMDDLRARAKRFVDALPEEQ